VGHRPSLDAVAKRKKIISLPLPGIEPWSSSPQPSHYTDSAAIKKGTEMDKK